MLQVKNLNIEYKKQTGIKNVNFKAQKGEIIGLIGADGAGKSSTLNAIAGVLAFNGEIHYDGIVYHNPQEAQNVKQYIGYMPQGIGLVLYETLSVAEHLDFFADIRGVEKNKSYFKYKEHLLKMAGLQRFTTRLASELSGGMMQKLSLICTMLHRPSLLILDEPTTGVDPLSRIELWEILKQSAKEFGTISIVSTAYMGEASKMDHLLLFDELEVIAQGTHKELLQTIKPYVYEKILPQKGYLNIGAKTYTLEKNIEAKHAKVDLEDLFFVNSLQKGKILPILQVDVKKDRDLPIDVIMESKKISKKFGTFYANKDVDISLKSGEILGLLGANGAGKTTFIKMLLGLLPIDNGELYLLGKKIKSAKDRKSLKTLIGYVSQHFALYDDMTLRENILFFASMHSISVQDAKQLVKKYAYELDFENYLDMLPKGLPLGINQRFSLAVALLHQPKLLFLDEPTSGVDSVARAQFWELLYQLKEKQGISILITTHYMSEAEYCDRIVLLKDGEKIADNTLDGFYREYPEAKDFETIFLEYYR